MTPLGLYVHIPVCERKCTAEALFTALRRSEGVDLASFREYYGVDPQALYAESLRDSLAAGLVEARGGRLRLTETGVLLSNEVLQALV